MDVVVLRSLTTLFMFLVFIGIVVWAWKGRRRSDFEAAAQLPFADDQPAKASEPESFSGATEQRARKASGLGAKRSHSELWRAFATTTGRLWA